MISLISYKSYIAAGHILDEMCPEFFPMRVCIRNRNFDVNMEFSNSDIALIKRLLREGGAPQTLYFKWYGYGRSCSRVLTANQLSPKIGKLTLSGTFFADIPFHVFEFDPDIAAIYDNYQLLHMLNEGYNRKLTYRPDDVGLRYTLQC